VALPPPTAAHRRRIAPAPGFRASSSRHRSAFSGDDLRWLAAHAAEVHVAAGAAFPALERGDGCVLLAGTFVGPDFASAGGRRLLAGDVAGALARRAVGTAGLHAETDAVVLTIPAGDLSLRTAWDPGFPARVRAAAVYLTPGRLAAARGRVTAGARKPVAQMRPHEMIEAMLAGDIAR
jgi:hypothetical protein